MFPKDAIWPRLCQFLGFSSEILRDGFRNLTFKAIISYSKIQLTSSTALISGIGGCVGIVALSGRCPTRPLRGARGRI